MDSGAGSSSCGPKLSIITDEQDDHEDDNNDATTTTRDVATNNSSSAVASAAARVAASNHEKNNKMSFHNMYHLHSTTLSDRVSSPASIPFLLPVSSSAEEETANITPPATVLNDTHNTSSTIYVPGPTAAPASATLTHVDSPLSDVGVEISNVSASPDSNNCKRIVESSSDCGNDDDGFGDDDDDLIVTTATDNTTATTIGSSSTAGGGERPPNDKIDDDDDDDDDENAIESSSENEYNLMRRPSSLLAEQDNPFTKREGKTLTWRNVNMTLKQRGNNNNNNKKNESGGRKILDNVWGSIPKQQTTAIMGPSGASKSTLLEVLAGRITSSGNIQVDADVRLDNVRVNPRKMKVAFVAQDDSLLSTATPRESIYFSAKLRLPRSTCEGQLNRLSDAVLLELGLEACADTLVGGPLVKGISGGERRRTSIGVELVVKPAVICLDEPTSGLDSFSAIKVFQVLQKVANAGASVVFSIHQPSSELFNGIDHLILMNKGRVMYQGGVSEMPAFFEKCGHPIPPRYNPADWILTVCHSNPPELLLEDGFYPRDEREQVDVANDSSTRSNSGTKALPLDTRPPGELVQLRLLFGREARNMWRNYVAVGARLLFTIVGSLLVGAIMLGIGGEDRDEPSNTQSQFGALIIVLLSSMVMTALPALLAFPEERPVFLREYATKHYSVVSYFLAHFTMELVLTGLQVLVMCIITYAMIGFQSNFFTYFITVYALAITSAAMAVLLGCGIEDPLLAQEMLPVLFIPQMLFAGFFVAPHLIPVWLRWIRYLCSLTFAVRILLVEEFNRDCGDAFAQGLCEYVLETADANPDEVWWYWLILVGLLIAFRLTALIILKKKATKYF